jgi:hypothetical protein
VRHENLGARRELIKESLGIERPFQGSRERSYIREEIGQSALIERL